MATLVRAWRVVTRSRGRPFAAGLPKPPPDARPGPKTAPPAPQAPPPPRKRKTLLNQNSHYPLERRVLGHHRGEPTMAYLVELHVTPDILARPPGGRCAALVNPANEALQGTRFDPTQANAAFPNTGVVYPEQTVDGAVTAEGGAELRAQLAAVPEVAPGVRCPVGAAVATEAVGGVASAGFDAVIHVVPPNFADAKDVDRWYPNLVRAYKSAMDVAWGLGANEAIGRQIGGDGDGASSDGKRPRGKSTPRPAWSHGTSPSSPGPMPEPSPSREKGAETRRRGPWSPLGVVATPLLGAGARGAPLALAARAAGEAVSGYDPPAIVARRSLDEWAVGEHSPLRAPATFAIRFAAADDETAEALEKELEKHLPMAYYAWNAVARHQDGWDELSDEMKGGLGPLGGMGGGERTVLGQPRRQRPANLTDAAEEDAKRRLVLDAVYSSSHRAISPRASLL